jgi:uncharacterized protein (DUF4415 family)
LNNQQLEKDGVKSGYEQTIRIISLRKACLMKEKSMNSISKTNWEKVDLLTEAEINTSDIPPLTDEFFSKSRWWEPQTLSNVVVQIDSDTLAWFQAQGADSERKMAAALRIYAAAHK